VRHLQDEFSAGELAVVSHADVVRAHFLAVPLDLALRIDVAPAHGAVLVPDHDDVRIEALNLPP
jgi:hypothetical protein